MKPRDLFFDELMSECGHDDPVEFLKILKYHRIHISRDKPVTFDQAKKIVALLQRRLLDPKDFKIQEPDRPLRWVASPEIAKLIQTGYGRLWDTANADPEEARDCLFGFFCQGGFLGNDPEGFVFSVDPGVNILIGERGAGKSTALNLMCLLSGRGRNPGQALLARLVGSLEDDRDAETDKARRIRDLLRYYSVTRYACYYRLFGQTFGYGVDLETATCALLMLGNDTWDFVPTGEEVRLIPSMHVLEQGEVFKIADEANRHYINELVDALFSDVREHRTKFLRRVRKLQAQYHVYPHRDDQARHLQDERAAFDSFVDRRLEEVSQLRRAVRSRRLRQHNDAILQLWNEHAQFVPQEFQSLSLATLFVSGEQALWHVLFGRMVRFLRKELPYILASIEVPRITATQPVEADEADDALVSAADSEEGLSEELPEQEPEDLGDPWELLENILRRITSRLFTMRSWFEAFTNLVPYDDPTKGLATAYIEFLQHHSELIEKQQNGCMQVQQVLNDEAPVHRVSTRNAGEILAETARTSRNLKALSDDYQKLMSMTARTEPFDVQYLLAAYGGTVIDLIERCKRLADRVMEDPRLETFFDPIEIELQQGSEFMPFEKLSFGQRSGIILKMVLGTTAHDIIILDQPEDNLDAHAVEQIASTLRMLGASRQVLVATHHSSLVMGIPEARLHVMASHGGAGVLKNQGRLADRELTSAVLDVLEGGKESFHHKMRTYADFLERLQGFIRDMEINEIESTFRRRTIDGLRNFLQPVVSSDAMIRFYRHELKNTQTMMSPELDSAREEIERQLSNATSPSVELLEKIDRVIASMKVHITQFQNKIEELRMLDTRPHPEQVNVGALLADIVRGISERRQSRQLLLTIQPELHETVVRFDRQHLRLVFENLFNNALRATESLALKALYSGNDDFAESVSVALGSSDDKDVTLFFTDNGQGIPETVIRKLYVERCTDREGADHGLGGILIRKMLDLNEGGIRVVETRPNFGTRQEIRLRRSVMAS
jgi:signal transduction histidine kinase